MMYIYCIDGKDVAVELESIDKFSIGVDEVLIDKYDDLTKNKAWHKQGYKVINSNKFFDKAVVINAVENSLKRIISEEVPGVNLKNFSLEKYHEYVNDEEHLIVISRTRRLYPKDFAFDSRGLLDGLSAYMGSELTFVNKFLNQEQWIIVRINRPNSIGFNPIHKDIYEAYDNFHEIPKMVNVWIPICGVSKSTGLPVAPGSHLLSENEIFRTRAGSTLNGQNYSVNSILNWGGCNKLQTLIPGSSEMVVFSSHLVHGLALNHHSDTTRISLEFRLYAAS